MERSSVNSIIREYNAMLSVVALRHLLRDRIDTDVNTLSKYLLHKEIESIFLKHFCGEAKIKSLLVNHFYKHQSIGGFEYRIGSSRADFLRVNGQSYCYEIKSEADSLYKLNKQAQDYESAFEFNSIVIDKKHYELAMDIVPEAFGIYLANNNNIEQIRKSRKNEYICYGCQIKAFNKKELAQYLGQFGQCTEEIENNATPNQINIAFKAKLKDRYSKRWRFLLENLNQINQVDYQFFMNRNIQPDTIYQKLKH